MSASDPSAVFSDERVALAPLAATAPSAIQYLSHEICYSAFGISEARSVRSPLPSALVSQRSGVAELYLEYHFRD